MFARVSKFEGGAPEAIDEQTESFRRDALPRLQGIEGFKGLFYLADRETGSGLAVTLWQDEQALRASEDAATQVREESVGEGERIAGVERYDVTMFELES